MRSAAACRNRREFRRFRFDSAYKTKCSLPYCGEGAFWRKALGTRRIPFQGLRALSGFPGGLIILRVCLAVLCAADHNDDHENIEQDHHNIKSCQPDLPRGGLIGHHGAGGNAVHGAAVRNGIAPAQHPCRTVCRCSSRARSASACHPFLCWRCKVCAVVQAVAERDLYGVVIAFAGLAKNGKAAVGIVHRLIVAVADIDVFFILDKVHLGGVAHRVRVAALAGDTGSCTRHCRSWPCSDRP